MSADLSDDVLPTLVEVVKKFRSLELKGQKASKKALTYGVMTAGSDFPYARLKHLRGEITQDELLVALTKVNNKEMSLAEMEADLVRIKEMRALRSFFIKYTNCASWKEAKERYTTIIIVVLVKEK